jgi:hypothetical protein
MGFHPERHGRRGAEYRGEGAAAPVEDAVTHEEGRPSGSEGCHHVGCHECEED